MEQSRSIHFFETPAQMRAWLEQHHRAEPELIVGFHRRHSVSESKRSITWPESIEEALCFGWIDGIRRPIDGDRYTVRFTPRRPSSKWSAVNIAKVAELEARGRMTAAGRAVFESRKDADSPGYKAQKKVGALDDARLEAFRSNAAAWAFFSAQPPGYQKESAWWVMHAKKDDTRDRRLKTLIEQSAAGKRLR